MFVRMSTELRLLNRGNSDFYNNSSLQVPRLEDSRAAIHTERRLWLDQPHANCSARQVSRVIGVELGHYSGAV